MVFLAVVISAAYGENRSFVGEVAGSDPEARLFRWLMEELKPEKARMIIDGPVGEDGKVRHLYMEAQGPSLDGLRVASVTLEAMFSDFGPVAEWNEKGPSGLREVVMGYFDAVMTDSDINGFLRGMIVEDDDGRWESLSVRFLPKGLSVSGYYCVKDPMDLKIKVDLDGALSLRDNAEIWIDNYSFRVNNDDQSSVVENALREVQPIVDMKDFIFPVQLKVLELKDGKMRLATRVSPKTFDGIALDFVSR